MSKNLNIFKSKKFSFLLISLSAAVPLIAQLFIALPARADCFYEGQKYHTGDTTGPYVCMPDGTWQQRE
jgi:hypothetical protein